MWFESTYMIGLIQTAIMSNTNETMEHKPDVATSWWKWLPQYHVPKHYNSCGLLCQGLANFDMFG